MGTNSYSGGGKGGTQPPAYNTGAYGGGYGGSWQPNFYGQNTDQFYALPVSPAGGGKYGGTQPPQFNPGSNAGYGTGGKKGGMQPPGYSPRGMGPWGMPSAVPPPDNAAPPSPVGAPPGTTSPPVNPAAQQRWDNYYANAAFPSSAPSTVATPPPATGPSGHTITTPASAVTPLPVGLGHTVTSPTGNLFRTITPATTPLPAAATPGHGAKGGAVDTTGLSPLQIAQQQYKITDPYKLQMISMGYMNPDGTPK